MLRIRRPNRRAFTLVELLAVVLVISVLAAVAIPAYLNTRKASAARACKANIATIASALAAYQTRHNAYPTTAQTLQELVNGNNGEANNAPEGLSAVPQCPLDGAAYKYTSTAAGPATVSCQHSVTGGVAPLHSDALTPVSATGDDWTVTLPVIAQDTIP